MSAPLCATNRDYRTHFLCSGKSELLRTLVVGLIASHSPEQVNLVLVDFKGGATFSGISGAPHVAAVITNLSDDALAVDRMYAALEGELRRRQEVLHAAGGFANIDEYVKARARGQVDTERIPIYLLWSLSLMSFLNCWLSAQISLIFSCRLVV